MKVGFEDLVGAVTFFGLGEACEEAGDDCRRPSCPGRYRWGGLVWVAKMVGILWLLCMFGGMGARMDCSLVYIVDVSHS